MGQFEYVNGMVNAGYKEIDASESPVKWDKKRGVIYLNKDNMYAMVDKQGYFVHWEHPRETEQVKGIYEYKKMIKVEIKNEDIDNGW